MQIEERKRRKKDVKKYSKNYSNDFRYTNVTDADHDRECGIKRD